MRYKNSATFSRELSFSIDLQININFRKYLLYSCNPRNHFIKIISSVEIPAIINTSKKFVPNFLTAIAIGAGHKLHIRQYSA